MYAIEVETSRIGRLRICAGSALMGFWRSREAR